MCNRYNNNNKTNNTITNKTIPINVHFILIAKDNILLFAQKEQSFP